MQGGGGGGGDQKHVTWVKYKVMQHVMESSLRIREKRRVFACMRQEDVTHDHFLPHIGVTLGEFSFWQLMSDSRRRNY